MMVLGEPTKNGWEDGLDTSLSSEIFFSALTTLARIPAQPGRLLREQSLSFPSPSTHTPGQIGPSAPMIGPHTNLLLHPQNLERALLHSWYGGRQGSLGDNIWMSTWASASPSLRLQCKPRARAWLQAQLKAGGTCLESTSRLEGGGGST